MEVISKEDLKAVLLPLYLDYNIDSFDEGYSFDEWFEVYFSDKFTEGHYY